MDWLELSAEDVPWGEPAFVPVGALSHWGRFRGVFCEQMTFGHLADAMHRVFKQQVMVSLTERQVGELQRLVQVALGEINEIEASWPPTSDQPLRPREGPLRARMRPSRWPSAREERLGRRLAR